jgi:hypothetical protein
MSAQRRAFEASVLASRLGQTILLSQRVEKDSAGLKTSLVSKP